MTTTETRIGRTTLKNPVICGSGEHVLTEAGLRSALAAGVGAVVAKSVNETQAAKDQLYRTDYALLDGDWNRLPWDFTGPRNATLACRSGLQTMDFDAWLDVTAWLDAEAAKTGHYVIGSIILADLNAAVDMAKQVQAAGIRILEYNVGTPYGDEAARGRDHRTRDRTRYQNRPRGLRCRRYPGLGENHRPKRECRGTRQGRP
jgi:dihydroorotate dehydrogenase